MKLEKVGKPQVKINRVDEQKQEIQGSKEKAEVFFNLLSHRLWVTILFSRIWCVHASSVYLKVATYLAAAVNEDICHLSHVLPECKSILLWDLEIPVSGR